MEPYYDSYVASIVMAGGVRVPVTLHAPDFRLDVERLRSAITPRTRLILLNSPHNPTGTVLTREELQAVANVAIEHDLYVVTDEVYEHLVYDGEHVPMPGCPACGNALDDLICGQDVCSDRLEDRLGDRTRALVAAVRTTKQFLTYVSGAPFPTCGGDRPGS